MFVALSLNPTNDTLASLRRVEIVASIAVLLVMGFLVLWLVRRDLRPLREMAQTADAIASGDLGRRVPQETPTTEVGRLGTALNEMLTQIETAFAEKSASEERLRQFVADASHELRTPLTSIRGYAELLRRGGFSDEAGTRKALQRVEEEATRMGGLVEDLLLLAELDRGRPLLAEPVGLHRICADVVEDSNAFAHEHTLTMGPGNEVVVIGDAERLTQVAHNLVRNALIHTPAGSSVRVSVRAEAGMGVLRVTDNGPGMDPATASARLRSFLPGRPGPLGSGHRAGTGHRAGHRGRPRRHGRGGAAGPGRAPRCWCASRWRPSRRGLARSGASYRRCAEPPGTRDSRTDENLTSVSAASASGSESATTPAPARRVSVRSSVWSSALRMPIIHSPSPSPSTHPTGPAQLPAVVGSPSAMVAERGVPRRAAHRGGGVYRSSRSRIVVGGSLQPALDARARGGPRRGRRRVRARRAP